MYDPPFYLWVLTVAEAISFPAATCAVLYGGALRAGLSLGRSALLAGAAAVALGGWLAASAVIAGHGWYHAKLGHGVPWMPVAAFGFLGLLVLMSRIPLVKRALTAPGMVSRLELPHFFRVGGAVFLIAMALGHLPALFALPAGIGDIATGLVAPFVAYKLARGGGGGRAALWLNAFGITDLVLALVLGALTAFQLVSVTPSAAPLAELPLALIPTTGVPLLLALHFTSVSTLRRDRRTPQTAAAAPLAAAGI